MFTIGNEELSKSPILKKLIYCDRCKHKHRISYPTDKDGNINHGLAFIHCDDGNNYLVGVNGKDIRNEFKTQ